MFRSGSRREKYTAIPIATNQMGSIKALYPHIYDKLTVNNFLVCPKSGSNGGSSYGYYNPWECQPNSNMNYHFGKSYNSQTGVLSVDSNIRNNNGKTAQTGYSVYLILPRNKRY